MAKVLVPLALTVFAASTASPAGFLYPGIGGIGLGGWGGGLYGLHGFGGEFVNNGVFGGGKKFLNDGRFEKAGGSSGGEFNQGKEGFANGVAAIKNSKGDYALFNDAAAGKKIVDDAKTYFGDQHFNKAAKQGAELSEKAGHKKGHVIKGFKTSHHKDEAGNTEEYYDEADDQGGKVIHQGHEGAFGANAASSLKGGHANGEFVEGGHKKMGHFDDEHLIDHNNADAGKYGEKSFGAGGATYGVNNGVDLSSLSGHHMGSNVVKALPFY